MTLPQPSPAAAIVPMSGLTAAVHSFADVSWHILMPYTIVGVCIMVYSQVRLERGQYALKHTKISKRSAHKKKVPISKAYMRWLNNSYAKVSRLVKQAQVNVAVIYAHQYTGNSK